MPTVTYTPTPPARSAELTSKPPRIPAPPCAVCGKAPAYQCGRCVGCYSIALVLGADHIAPGYRPTLPLPPLPITTAPTAAQPAAASAIYPCHNKVCDRPVRGKGCRCPACKAYYVRHKCERPEYLIKAAKKVRDASRKRVEAAAFDKLTPSLEGGAA